MTLEERMAIIEKKRASIIAEESKKRELEYKRLSNGLKSIKALEDRIDALITLANKCVEQRIDFPSITDVYGYGNGYNSYNFCADGIKHHVGFMGHSFTNKRVEYIGIYNGGAHGEWDFYTNGNIAFSKHEKDGTIVAAKVSDVENFLDEFDLFEESFYKWIDSLA